MESKRSGMKTKSILYKMFFPIFLVMILQTTIFVFVTIRGGVMDMLKDNAYAILSEKVANRGREIEAMLNNRCSNVESSVSEFNYKYEGFLHDKNMDTETFCNDAAAQKQFLSENYGMVVNLLRRNGVNGAFIILNTGYETTAPTLGETHIKNGICVRDLDPNSGYMDDADLLVERAPSSIVKKMGYTLNTWWEAAYELTVEDEYFYKPLLAAYQYPKENYDDLSYWMGTHRISKTDVPVISYSVPLKDKNGVPYGVLGVELTDVYISSSLPVEDLGKMENGSYVLAGTTEGGVFNTYVKSGSAYKNLFGSQTSISTKGESLGRSCYNFNSRPDFDDAIGSIYYLNIYNSNTPFINEQLALLGITDEGEMFSFNQKVEQSILWASLIALLLGIIGIVAVSDFFTRPITKLAQKVRKIKPQSDFKLDRLGIYEIDELINSIEDLNKRAMENQNKLSTVVHMTGLPIGAFEIDRRTNEEEFTRDFNEVFIEKLKLNETVENFTKASFREKLESFEEYLFLKEEESASVYRLPYIDEEWRYIRLRRVISDEKILGLMVDVTEEFEEKQKIEYERDHDLLTSLYNRRAFYSEIEKVFENPASIGVGAMVMMDIDNLKFINDTYGHDYGDAYIKAAAEVLKVFKGDKTLITRMSGDEFLVFIYGTLSKKAVKEKIEAIKEAFVGAYMSLPENENFKIRISGGVAWYPYDSEMYSDLVKFADFAMYQVKKSTKGDFRDFDAETYDRDGYLLQGRGRLNKLIDDDLVDYNFQAIVDINKAEIFAYEALMRPNDGYMRTPQEVITLARNEGKLYQIEKLTWRKSLERFEEGLDKVSDTCKVFVNTIPNQMLTEADYDELYERFGSMFSRVVLEVTEEDKLDEHALHRWEKIRTLGIETAIDDYGSGYNAQTLLIELSPNYVKIDMELVRNIDKDENRQATVNSLLQYTKPRGIRTIAEGVETIEELKYMFSAGVDFVQGYLLQKPSNEPSELEENTKELLRNISI